MTILDSGDYAAIRAVLGMDATSLPDATLALFLGDADREIKRLVTGWAALSGDDLATLETAAVYLTAARIAGAPSSSKVSGFGFSVEANTVTPDALRELAYLELAALGVERTTSYGFRVQAVRDDGYTAVEEAL